MVETINGVLCVSVPEASEKSYKLLIGVYTLIIILTVFLLLSKGSDYLKPAVHVYFSVPRAAAISRPVTIMSTFKIVDD